VCVYVYVYIYLTCAVVHVFSDEGPLTLYTIYGGEAQQSRVLCICVYVYMVYGIERVWVWVWLGI
jgi:hypothetical protein